MPTIHPTAIIDPRAQLADDVTIGAYVIIRGQVHIGPGTRIDDHSHIHGHTVFGRDCRIGPAAYVGMDPQDFKYKGDTTHLLIGDRVIIRETATVHRSALPGPEHATRVGDRCFLMAAAHIGHNTVLANDVVLANAVLLAGHVTVGERAFLGGGLGIHQFCRVGRLAVIAGGESLSQDVPPFAAARYRMLKGYNAVGCRRAGMSRETVTAIRAAYRCLYRHRVLSTALAAIRAEVPLIAEVQEILDFITASRRGIVPSLSVLRKTGTIPANDVSEAAPD